MNIDNNLRQLLENETKIHLRKSAFYQKLDRQLGLNGARFLSPLALILTGSVHTLRALGMMKKNFIFRCFSSATVYKALVKG